MPHTSTLPRRPNGSIDWRAYVSSGTPGDVFSFTAEDSQQAALLRGGASRSAADAGIRHKTSVRGKTVTILFLEPDDAPAKSDEVAIRLATILRELAEAREQIQLWSTRRTTGTTEERIQAGARLLIWKSTLAAREARLTAMLTAH